MSASDLQQQLAQAEETICLLQEELAETNRGLVALTMELEDRVALRTAELREAHAELERTNSELVQLTLDLEDRVTQRTAELQAKTEEARVMSQQLWQAAKLATMGELGASIAHELNNPLATVSLRVESLLAQAPSDDPKRRSLEIIEQEVDRMGTLVAHLLEFSRRSQQQTSTVDARTEIEATLELIHHHLRKHSIRVVKDYAADTPSARADRQQLRQVFLNLFTNASDAMPKGGTLTIRVRTESGPSTTNSTAARHLVIEVADTGIGIAREHLESVFEPFFTTKPEGKGTGLGLPICRRIIQEHAGTMDLISEAGVGTTVRVRLPLGP